MSYTTKDAVLHLARYNQRANRELYDALSKLTDKARKRGEATWFGSIHRLLNHLLVADFYWLQRFRPIHPSSEVIGDSRLWPRELSWKHDLSEDFEELKRQRAFIDERIIDWFEECPEDRYDLAFEYVDSAGVTRTATAGHAFEFLFVHQIHHRGQVAQVLDSLGLPNNLADNGAFLDPEQVQ